MKYYFTIGNRENYLKAMEDAKKNNEYIYKDVGGYAFETIEAAESKIKTLDKTKVYSIFLVECGCSDFDEITKIEGEDIVFTNKYPIRGIILC